VNDRVQTANPTPATPDTNQMTNTSDHDRPARNRTRLSRRAFATTGLAALAGCLGGNTGDGTGSGDDSKTNEDGALREELPSVEDPPEAVYLPSHRDPFVMQSPVTAGDYALLPHVGYPHRFWLVDGNATEEVLPTLEDSLHLMVSFWDRETGELLPVDAGATLSVSRDGDPVETVAPWPMLAQTMGFHFGDNVPLPGDGTYTVEVTVNPIQEVHKKGAFEGRFEQTRTTTFEFEWTDDRRRSLVDDIRYLEETRRGDPGALEPMHHGNMEMGNGDESTDSGHVRMGDIPSPSLPRAAEYPGTDLGVHESGDAAFVVRYLADSRLATGDGGYLLVSPRTPHNRFPLPDMSLSLSLSDGVVQLDQTLDDELGMHYGRPVDISPVEQFDLVVDGPPQIARHRGYETAFLDMPPMTVEVDT
jgi:hypothetical protein